MLVKAEKLNKCYRLYNKPIDRLKQKLSFGRKRYYEEFQALSDVSFEIIRGETIGVIGPNGAGKSTLLQLICGILHPSSGKIIINGKIAALLELGAGFNFEFTGRENVYLNAALLGLTKTEIDECYHRIVSFADIGEFINYPVKTYSSGMVIRLAFAVNLMTTPDLMIIDEALAIGDINFTAKCMSAIKEMQKKGTSIILVSHDMGTIRNLCNRVIYLENGRLIESGPPNVVVEKYIKIMREKQNLRYKSPVPEKLSLISERAFDRSSEFERRVEAFRYGTGAVKIKNVELLNEENQSINTVEFNQNIKFNVYLESSSNKKISVVLNILDNKKNSITGCSFTSTNQPYLETKVGGKYLLEFEFQLPLQEGHYSVFIQIAAPLIEDTVYYDVVTDAIVFEVNKWKIAPLPAKVYLFPKLNVVDL
jgi:lipopolysaccharide transport system ATP-binding protein